MYESDNRWERGFANLVRACAGQVTIGYVINDLEMNVCDLVNVWRGKAEYRMRSQGIVILCKQYLASLDARF